METTITAYRLQCIICGETRMIDNYSDDMRRPDRILFRGPIDVIKHIRQSHGNGTYGLKEAKDIYDAGVLVEKAVRHHAKEHAYQQIAILEGKLGQLRAKIQMLEEAEKPEVGGIVPRPFQAEKVNALLTEGERQRRL